MLIHKLKLSGFLSFGPRGIDVDHCRPGAVEFAGDFQPEESLLSGAIAGRCGRLQDSMNRTTEAVFETAIEARHPANGS